MTKRVPHLVITRPVDDALITQHQLDHMGYHSVIEPMLHIDYPTKPCAQLHQMLKNNTQAIIVSSANAVRALDTCHAPKDLLIVTVGQSTANYAKNHGFNHVETANGNIDNLVSYIAQRFSPNNGPVIYASANVTHGNLTTRLRKLSFDINQITMYHSIAAEQFSQPFITALTSGSLNGVLFFSSRTAAIFSTLIHKHNLHTPLANMVAMCLSKEITSQLSATKFCNLCYATEPTTESFLELLKNFQFTEH